MGAWNRIPDFFANAGLRRPPGLVGSIVSGQRQAVGARREARRWGSSGNHCSASRRA